MVDRLPYETFKEIIQIANAFVPSRNRPERDPIPYDSDGLSLPPIKASHVCRSWRTALLSDPTMWTCLRIPQTKPAAVREMLHRSGAAPFSVFIEPRPNSPCLNVQEINMIAAVFRSEMHRLRELQITDPANGPGRQWVFIVLPYLKHPAPELQRFYLDVSPQTVPGSEDFLRALFSEDSPRLSHVSQRLSGSQTLLCCPLFQSLSSLHFEFTGRAIIHCDTLLDILQLSPRLHTFGLNVSHPTPLMTPSNPGRCVHLPHLRQLSLWGNFSVDMINHVLNRLTFPLENLEYHIQCDKVDTDSHVAPLLSLFAQRRPTFLSMSCFNFKVPTLEFFQSYSSHAEVFPTFKTHLDNIPKSLETFSSSGITHFRLGGELSGFILLRDVFLSLPNIQHLRIIHKLWSHSVSALDTSFLVALMPGPSNMQTEDLEDHEFEKILINLNDDDGPRYDDSQASAHTTVLPCLSLRSLEIIVSQITKLDESYVRMVSTCSEKRRRAGHPFKHIIIHCRQSLSLENVASWLQPCEGFPIEILKDIGMDVDDDDLL